MAHMIQSLIVLRMFILFRSAIAILSCIKVLTLFLFVLTKQTKGVKIDIFEDVPGLINIYSVDMDSAEEALRQINLLTRDVEVGEIYDGLVKSVMPYGAFIEILPGKEGLLHISNMENFRVDKVEDVMNVGDVVKVKVNEIDSQDRINLTRKELLKRD